MRAVWPEPSPAVLRSTSPQASPIIPAHIHPHYAHQGDARIKKHAELCKEYLPTKLTNAKARKIGCAQE